MFFIVKLLRDTVNNDDNGNVEKPEKMLGNVTVNAEEWRLEVERVTPLLKV